MSHSIFQFIHLTGTKPEKVINFKCRSYNWENLTCTFERPYNPVPVNYTLYYATGFGDDVFKMPVSVSGRFIFLKFSKRIQFLISFFEKNFAISKSKSDGNFLVFLFCELMRYLGECVQFKAKLQSSIYMFDWIPK